MKVEMVARRRGPRCGVNLMDRENILELNRVSWGSSSRADFEMTKRVTGSRNKGRVEVSEAGDQVKVLGIR